MTKPSMPTKSELFLSRPLLTGALEEVPGLGAVGIQNLRKQGIKTTYQLIGAFLAGGRDVTAMTDKLVEMGNRRQDCSVTGAALCARVATRGVKVDIKLSDHVVATTASRFGDDKKTAFIQKKLTGKLSSDFFGISEASEANFKAVGIATTDALFGAFLKLLDDEEPSKSADKCDAFYAKLGALGAAKGFKSVIIYQLQAKLAVGIDSHGPAALRAAMPVLPEEGEEGEPVESAASDRTGGSNANATRRRHASQASGVASASRQLFADRARPGAAASGGDAHGGSSAAAGAGSSFLLATMPCALLAFALFSFFCTSRGPSEPAMLPNVADVKLIESEWL